jgi:polysaccharide biosynthesis/export protein
MTAAHTALAFLALLGPSAFTGHGQQLGTKPAVTVAPPQTAAPAEPATTAPTPVPKGGVDPNYVIGPSDTLDVNVFNEPKFSGNLPVRPDGMISIALLGDIPAAGLTPMQLGAEISTRLKKLITDPSVTVSVLSINSKRVYLVGEVGKVGPLPMTPGMTPLQAIATAGGPGPYANTKRIYILRTVNGKQQKIPFNYKKALKDGDMQGVSLVSGDTIVIP